MYGVEQNTHSVGGESACHVVFLSHLQLVSHEKMRTVSESGIPLHCSREVHNSSKFENQLRDSVSCHLVLAKPLLRWLDVVTNKGQTVAGLPNTAACRRSDSFPLLGSFVGWDKQTTSRQTPRQQ
jgi:hypothetical protein